MLCLLTLSRFWGSISPAWWGLFKFLRVLIVTHDQPAQHTPPYYRRLNRRLYLPFGETSEGTSGNDWLSVARGTGSDPFSSVKYQSTTPSQDRLFLNGMPSSRCSIRDFLLLRMENQSPFIALYRIL